MKKFSLKITLLLLVILMISCKDSNSKSNEIAENQSEEKTMPSLKNIFKDDFLIGAALNANQILDTTQSKEALLIKNQFNSVTPENMLKSMHVQPEKDKFNFEVPDKLMELAEKNNMHVVGHTLVWHSQLPEWVSKIEDKESLEAFMSNHIKTVVSRYEGKVDGWDVVNEALNEDGTLRESIFFKTIGKEYLTNAFKLAEETDPKAELYYNDFNLCQPSKREGAKKLITMLKENGAKVDGVGIQAHWDLNWPSLEEIEKSILEFSEMDIKVMFTELDVTVLPSPWNNTGADVNKSADGDNKMNPFPNGLPQAIQDQLAERYKSIFDLFLKHRDKIDRVTFWGVNDKQSWKNNWPINGRTDYPLLFDTENNPKKAFYSIVELKKQ